MFKEGIIDPVKVVRTALQMQRHYRVLVTTGMVADKPEEKDAAAGNASRSMGGMGGMGGMGM